MGDDGYFVRHGHRGAVEFGGFSESEAVGERAGFVKLLLVFETENVVYGAVEERGEGVRDWVAEEVIRTI